MGFRFRKSVSLAKGVKLNINKKGVSISGGIKGKKSSSKRKSLSKSKLEVMENNPITSMLSIEAPKEIRSKFYPYQSILGGIGILCIFISFLKPILLPIGAMFIYSKITWRKQTDPAVVHYKNITKYYQSKKFKECIEAINYVLQHPQSDCKLNLIKAECYLNLEDDSAAYSTYKSFFAEFIDTVDNMPIYWSAKVNTILLALENLEFHFSLQVAETLENAKLSDVDNRLWKSYFKGLSFMGMNQYESAIHAFQDAIGRKRSMEEPFIDAHYQMGIAYAKLGKNSLAKQRFSRVYSAKSGYKKTSEIMELIKTGGVGNLISIL